MMLRNIWYMIKYKCLIHPLAKLDKNIILGKGCKIGKCEMQTYGGKGRIRISRRTIVYNNVELFAHKNCIIQIGNDCLISRGTCIMTANHEFFKGELIREQNTIDQHVIMYGDIWTGYRSVILPDTVIGEGAVIAACAVVTKDVMPNTIVAGVPAKPIKKRVTRGSQQKL